LFDRILSLLKTFLFIDYYLNLVKGKKLTSWERSQRRRERQAELDQNASRRAREREARA